MFKGKEAKMWLLILMWVMYIALLGPWLISAASDIGLLIGIALGLVLVRVTYSVIQKFNTKEKSA